MSRRFKTNLVIASTTFTVTSFVTLLLLREPTVAMTPELLAEARATWRSTGMADYDLDYAMNGNVCRVAVRGGIVTSLLVNGAEGNSSQLRFFSVDGLFDTLAMDLEALAGRGGSGVLMRVRFNPEYGYVERYVRSSGGAARGAEITGVVFTPVGARLSSGS